ncbi:MAG: hypothetical protein WDZ35_05550 [Crocinitomicaceae bacterium]
MQTLKKYVWKFKVPLILLLVLIVAFPGLVTMQRSMFWDITLHNLPWRYHIGESISNGELPLWLPWMNYGFPQMGHYETWYPVSWFVGGLFGYNLSVLQFEYLFHIYLAGLGFYLFSGLLKDLNWKVRMVGAIAYMLCGVFIAQASHYGYVVSGTWMPFVFYFLIRFCRNTKLENGLALVFFYFLLVTGGYVGNFIVITYILIGIFVYQLYLRRKDRAQLLTLLKYTALLIPVFFAVYAVVFYSMLDIKNHITRQALEYSNTGWGAQVGTWVKEGFITFFSPLANMQTENDFWGDAPMINDVYIGIFPVIFLIYYFFIGRSDPYYRQIIYLTVGSLFFFAIALSTLLPLHKWLYHSLPLLDYFRFPSLYRIFGLFLLLLAGLRAIQYIITTVSVKKRLLFLSTCIIALWLIAIPFLKSNLQFRKIFLGWDKAVDLLDQNALFLVDAIFMTVLLLILIAFNNSKKIGWVLLILVTVDLTVHTWIRTPHYIVDP